MTGFVALAMWCGIGGLVGSVIGAAKDRPAMGIVLGTACGVFGWIFLLGAEPRTNPMMATTPALAAPQPDHIANVLSEGSDPIHEASLPWQAAAAS